jgi:hypothetical protein
MLYESIKDRMGRKEWGCMPDEIYLERTSTRARKPRGDEGSLMSRVGVYIEVQPSPKVLGEKGHASPLTANLRKE